MKRCSLRHHACRRKRDQRRLSGPGVPLRGAAYLARQDQRALLVSQNLCLPATANCKLDWTLRPAEI